jgi:uncharacterized tellurite resistance protein B-like protein
MNPLLQSHFLNLYAMALSDMQIDTVELETLYRIGQDKGIEKSQIDNVILHPDKVRFTFPDTLEEKIVHLFDFAKVILADGKVDQNERKTLELFCARFGFEDDNIISIADFLLDSATKGVSINELLSIINQN